MKTREEFVKMINDGLSQREAVETAVRTIFEKGCKNVFMVGCGGSLAVMMPMRSLISRYSELRAEAYNSDEFLRTKPRAFGEKSIYITSSYTGTTPETVAAAQYARDCGAHIIAFTGNLDSPLAHLADCSFACGSKLVIMYQIVFYLLYLNGDYPQYADFQKTLTATPDQVYDAMLSAKKKAAAFAEQYKDEDFFFVTGSGACYGEAYTYACCLLEEMQWIRAQPVHAGEFFHGAFEMLTGETPIFILRGEDETRPLGDRVIAFAQRYTEKIIDVDTAQYQAQTPAISGEMRAILSPLLLSSILSMYSEALAEKRGHPLSTRRYMFKVEY